jgi:hypothetical protein
VTEDRPDTPDDLAAVVAAVVEAAGWFIIGPEGQVAGFRKNCPHDYPHKVIAYRLRPQ